MYLRKINYEFGTIEMEGRGWMRETNNNKG